MPQRSPVRPARLRGSVLAALVTLLTVAGHVAGGGTVAGLSPLAVLVPLLATVLVTLAERCRGPVATVALLGAGQLGLHLLLQVLSPHGHAGSPAPAAAGMLAAHAVATLLAAAAVTHADAAASALLAALRRTRPRRPAPAVVDVPPRVHPAPDPAVPLRAGLVPLTAHVRRGPPVLR